MKLIYTASQIRDAEKPYIEAPDYDGYLMQRAADAVATEAIDLLDGRQGASVLLLVGPGNNGSDTVYAGARLSTSGYKVDAVVFESNEKNLELIAREGGEGTCVLDPAKALEHVKDYDLIIDGILGTGSSGAVRGEAGSSYVPCAQPRRRGASAGCLPSIPPPASTITEVPCTNPSCALTAPSPSSAVSYRSEPSTASTPAT